MLPVEYVPTDQYMQVYHNALKHYAKPVANAVGMLADKIIELSLIHIWIGESRVMPMPANGTVR